jgi:cation:H+ antiporter
MTLLINALIFGAALFALIKSANFITEAAIEISKHLGIPRTVIGATIIALITTLPETITTIMAGIQGHNNLGIGNAFGTPAANIGLILGITFILSNPQTKPHEIRQNIYILIAIITIIGYLYFDRDLGLREGLLLIAVACVYLYQAGIQAYKHAHLSEKLLARIDEQSHKLQGKQKWHVIKDLALGGILLPIAAYAMTYASINIASTIGIPDFLIGLTLISIGTSLPEIAIAITLYVKKTQDLSFGNLTGASILTLTLALGISLLFSPYTISKPMVLFTFPFLLAILLSTLTLTRDGIESRITGIMLVTWYIFFTLSNVFLSTL